MQRITRIVLVALALVAVLLGVLLALDNSVSVSLRFLDWSTRELPVFWWMAMAVSLGFALGVAATWPTGVRHRLGARSARRQLRAAEEEVRELRSIAVRD